MWSGGAIFFLTFLMWNNWQTIEPELLTTGFLNSFDIHFWHLQMSGSVVSTKQKVSDSPSGERLGARWEWQSVFDRFPVNSFVLWALAFKIMAQQLADKKWTEERSCRWLRANICLVKPLSGLELITVPNSCWATNSHLWSQFETQTQRCAKTISFSYSYFRNQDVPCKTKIIKINK